VVRPSPDRLIPGERSTWSRPRSGAQVEFSVGAGVVSPPHVLQGGELDGFATARDGGSARSYGAPDGLGECVMETCPQPCRLRVSRRARRSGRCRPSRGSSTHVGVVATGRGRRRRSRRPSQLHAVELSSRDARPIFCLLWPYGLFEVSRDRRIVTKSFADFQPADSRARYSPPACPLSLPCASVLLVSRDRGSHSHDHPRGLGRAGHSSIHLRRLARGQEGAALHQTSKWGSPHPQVRL
jgi:hypothetical protein